MSMQKNLSEYLRKKLFFVYLKFKFTRASCILSGSCTLKRPLMANKLNLATEVVTSISINRL